MLLPASVTNVSCPPRTTSKLRPRVDAGVTSPQERVPVLTVAWQVIAAVKPPLGTVAGAVASRSAHATANVLDKVAAKINCSVRFIGHLGGMGERIESLLARTPLDATGSRDKP